MCTKCEGYQKLLASSESMKGDDKIVMQEYETTLEGDMDLGKKS